VTDPPFFLLVACLISVGECFLGGVLGRPPYALCPNGRVSLHKENKRRFKQRKLSRDSFRWPVSGYRPEIRPRTRKWRATGLSSVSVSVNRYPLWTMVKLRIFKMASFRVTSTEDFFVGLGTPLRNLKRRAVRHAIPTAL